MKRTTLAALLLSPLTALAADQGYICVAQVDARPADKALELGNVGNLSPYKFKVNISGAEPVIPSVVTTTRVGPLALGKKRRISIFNNGKPFTSFNTTYPDREFPQMCLWFDAMYQTWSYTSPKGHGTKCRCRER